MLVFTIRQVRNRLLISALHIKTPSLLSHCLFHPSTPSSSAIHLQFAPGQSLRLDQLCDFVFAPPNPSRTPILPRAVLPVEFLPQFCQCRYLSNSEGVHQIIFRDRSIQSPSLSLTLSLPPARGQKLKHLPQVGRPIVRPPEAASLGWAYIAAETNTSRAAVLKKPIMPGIIQVNKHKLLDHFFYRASCQRV